MPFIAFLYWLELVFGAMLYKSNESRHLCLIPSLKGKAFSLSPLNTMLATGFFPADALYQVEVVSPLFLFF